MHSLLGVFLPGCSSKKSALRDNTPSTTERVKFCTMLISAITKCQIGFSFWGTQHLVHSK